MFIKTLLHFFTAVSLKLLGNTFKKSSDLGSASCCHRSSTAILMLLAAICAHYSHVTPCSYSCVVKMTAMKKVNKIRVA